MEARLKADQLLQKFNWSKNDKEYIVHQLPNESIRCALIAVDEIIDYLKSSDWAVINNKSKYWQEVKTEIEKCKSYHD